MLQLATEKMAQNISEFPPKFVPFPAEAQNPSRGKAYWIPIMIIPSKGKVRLVFDAAAKFGGRCLNDEFLAGPDCNNSLRAVLCRFRMHPVAFTADIKNMFHQFFVPEEDRTYMRFFWFKYNDPSQPLIEYWSCVHLQGLTGSPAIADIGRRFASLANPPTNIKECLDSEYLQKTSSSNPPKFPDPESRTFSKQYYVDDLLASKNSSHRVIETLEEARSRLGRYNLWLCKFESNHADVLAHFPEAKRLPPIVELPSDAVPSDVLYDGTDSAETAASSALGVRWDTVKDALSSKTAYKDRRFTKRGLVGHVNTTYDPDGIIAPARLDMRLMHRDVCPPKKQDVYNCFNLGWDDPLPECLKPKGNEAHPTQCECYRKRWDRMVETMGTLHEVSIPRAVYPSGVPVSQQLFAFADASEVAIACVIYLRTVTSDDKVHVAFIKGVSKVIPRDAKIRGVLSIPRAELNAAVAAAEAVLQLQADLKDEIVLLPTQYFTDSEDVIAWINNRSDPFKRYVTSRRDKICQISDSSQWHWIPGGKNPADIGTRSISVKKLRESDWISGPEFVRAKEIVIPGNKKVSEMEITEMYGQERMQSKCMLTQSDPLVLENDVMDGSAWSEMIRGSTSSNPTFWLIKDLQQRAFPEGLTTMRLARQNSLQPKQRMLIAMTPFMDEEGLIRAGGRLTRADVTFGCRFPILIPEGVEGDAFIGYIHANKAKHQEKIVTNDMIREEGFLPLGGKKRIDKLLQRCVECRRLRGKPMQQKMADLTSQRLEKTPPFQCSGMDVFGPFKVNNGRVTRADTGTRKIWVLLFTCMYSRGVHMETVWSMDTASFIMAFTRFEALRGECLYLKCDAGSNFMGERNKEERETIYGMIGQVDKEWAKDWMKQGKGRVCDVNPPKASHFGGVWERVIGSVRKVIEAMLMPLQNRL